MTRETSRHRHRRHSSRRGSAQTERLRVDYRYFTRGRTLRGYRIFVVVRKGHSTCYKYFGFVLLVVIMMHQTLSQLSRLGMMKGGGHTEKRYTHKNGEEGSTELTNSTYLAVGSMSVGCSMSSMSVVPRNTHDGYTLQSKRHY